MNEEMRQTINHKYTQIQAHMHACTHTAGVLCLLVNFFWSFFSFLSLSSRRFSSAAQSVYKRKMGDRLRYTFVCLFEKKTHQPHTTVLVVPMANDVKMKTKPKSRRRKRTQQKSTQKEM